MIWGAVRENSLSLGKTSDLWADFDHDTGYIFAQDERILQKARVPGSIVNTGRLDC